MVTKKSFLWLFMVLISISLVTATTYVLEQDFSTYTGNNDNFGGTNANSAYVAGEFTTNNTYNFAQVTVRLKKNNNPTVDVRAQLWSNSSTNNLPDSLIATSNNTFDPSTFSVTYDEYNFTFNGTTLTNNTKYWLAFSRVDAGFSATDTVSIDGLFNGAATGKDTARTPSTISWSTWTNNWAYYMKIYSDGSPVVNNFTIYANDFYTGSGINTFSANVTYNGTTTSYNTTLGFIETNIAEDSGLVNVSIYANNYFTNTTNNYNTSSDITRTLTSYTLLQAYYDTTQINNFTVNTSSYTSSTTNGDAYLPLYNGTFSVQIRDAQEGSTFYNSETVNLTANPYLRAYNFSLLLSNTFNISFYNESTNNLLDNVTINVELISDTYATNYTTNNGTLNASLLVPDSYTIRYWRESTVIRDYYVTLTNQSFNNLRLYLVDDSASDLFLPTVNNENDEACNDNTVSLLRYYIDINGYRVVEMAKTDVNGQAVLAVVPNVINYKLLFSGSCGTFTTSPQKIVSQTEGYTVVGDTTLLTSAEAINNATISIAYNNVTQTYSFTWNDASNVVTQGCLVVYRHFRGVQTTNYSACSSSSTGSQIYTLTGNLTNTRWSAQGYLNTNTQYSTYSYRAPDVEFLTSIDNWGVTGVFFGLIFFVAIIMASASTASTIIFAGVGGLAVLITMGIIAGAGVALTGLLILGVIILYKMRS